MFPFAKRPASRIPQADNPYWMSFSDMMSGMLIIFILVCIALLFKLSQMVDQVTANVEELRTSSTVRKAILDDIHNLLADQGIEVLINEDQTILRIPEESLHFKTNKYDIQDKMQPTAEKIGRAIYMAIIKDQRWRYLDTVFVEGHSDSRKALQFSGGNWELSAMRAISLWQFWTEETDYGATMKELRNREGRRLFSVSGYAATRRVAEREDSEDAMRKNRRIDIRFTTRQPSIMDMQDVLSPLQ